MNPAIRLPLAVLGALLFTGAMFYVLWAMVHGIGGYVELKPVVKIEFTPLRKDTRAESKRDKVERPKPQQAPQVPQMQMASTSLTGGDVGAMNPNLDFKMGDITVAPGSDRDVIPLVRINPEYPRRAQQRGIEGWVQVEFTITPAGTVANPTVIDADPKGLFEDAAVKAISRWKYNPKVEEGRAVERRGVRVVMRFDLDD
jgi:protein TonB